MRYQEWIKAKEHLSAADRQAYAHELQDNPRLQAEEAAIDLTDALLRTAAEDLPEREIVEGPPSDKKHTQTGLLIGGAVVLLLLLVSGYFYQQRVETPDVPATPAPVKELEPRFPEPPSVVPEGEEPVAQYTPPAPTVVPSKVVAKKTVEPAGQPVSDQTPRTLQEAAPALAEGTTKQPGEDIVLHNTQVDEGAALSISAKNSITLKPGFHAKAGARFTAKVTPMDTPLR